MRFASLSALFAICLFAVPAYAAQVYIDAGDDLYPRLDTFYVPVRIDTQGACMNAVDVVVSYDPQELMVHDVAIGNSIITLWAEKPTVERSEGGAELGRVHFSGGVPGGYCGRVAGDPGTSGVLVELVMRGVPQALAIGEMSTTTLFLMPETAVYRNDGTGEVLDHTLLGAELTLVQTEGTPQDVWASDVESDTIAPELFEITFVKGPSVGNRKSYVVFNTVDKQSGMSHYEILETDPDRFGLLKWFPRESLWTKAESPYVLRDQRLHSKILVKAVDRKGNERVVTYEPPVSIATELTNPYVVVVLALGLVLIAILVLAVLLVVRALRRKGVTGDTEQTENNVDAAHEEVHKAPQQEYYDE